MGTATVRAPSTSLRVLGAAMDIYKQVFVSGRAASLLSQPNPVRRTGFDLDVVVDTIRAEADDVVSLALRAPDRAPLPAWRPGSHIDVFLPSGRQRQYSLCGNPADRFTYRIAVRRIATGDGGSIEMHDTVRPGTRLRIRGPRNAFMFVDAPSYLFVAGGIGITPILPMVEAAAASGADWQLVYFGRSRASMPFRGRLRSHGHRVQLRADDHCGPPDIAEIVCHAKPGAAVYICGPTPILDAAQDCMFALNPTGSLHTERFSAAPVVGGAEFDVTLARSGTTVRVGAAETTLAAIGRELPGVVYSCRQGFCGTCKVGVLRGEVDHRDRLLTEPERHDTMLTCVSRAAGGSLVLDL